MLDEGGLGVATRPRASSTTRVLARSASRSRRRRDQAPDRQSGPSHHQDLGRQARSTAWSRRPARVFDDQKDLQDAFGAASSTRDFVAVVRFQGPRANGMPELHKLTPSLGVLQDRGFKVALVTDGRMSGASGKVPAAIHVTPECAVGGPLARVRNGDRIRLDSRRGVLEVRVDAAKWEGRGTEVIDLGRNREGTGRELFDVFRANVTGAEEGAMSFYGSVPATASVPPVGVERA